MREYRQLPIELKSLSTDDPGTFEGTLSTYGGSPDLQGDVVQPGAFTKTLKENRGTVPLFLNHDPNQQVGVLKLHDTPTALAAKGKLNLDVPLARDAYSNMLFNAKHGVKTGLSIGFRTIKDRVEGSTRHLVELALGEGSITLFPANEQALVSAVKSEIDRRRDETLIGLMEELKNSFRKGIHA